MRASDIDGARAGERPGLVSVGLGVESGRSSGGREEKRGRGREARDVSVVQPPDVLERRSEAHVGSVDLVPAECVAAHLAGPDARARPLM